VGKNGCKNDLLHGVILFLQEKTLTLLVVSESK
jgi:hypothetical protein